VTQTLPGLKVQRLKVVLSWVVVAAGVFTGLYALGIFGTDYFPSDDRSQGWYLRWIDLAGVGLLAAGFLAGSLTAPRNPKRAGVVFLAFLPVTASCMAYPDAGFMMWDKAGNGWFETPAPATAIGLALTFFAPLAALLFEFRQRKRAAIAFSVLTLIAIPVFVLSRWTSVLLPRLAGFAVPFLLFGLYWLWTDEFRWPVLVRAGPRTFARRVAGVVITLFLVFSAGIAMGVFRASFFSSLFNGDCGARPPFTHAQQKNHAVFTARAIYVGRSVHTMQELRFAPKNLRDSPVGDWAIGVVQERFWGVPSRWPHLVLMTNLIYWKGGTYFIDGGVGNSLLSKILPVVAGGIGCSRSKLVQEAGVDLRLLRDAPPRRAAIVGSVRQPGPYAGMMNPFDQPKFLSGAQIEVTGADGTRSVATDPSGVYVLDGLGAGDYTVRLHVPEGRRAGGFHADGSFDDQSVRTVHLKADELGECDFALVGK
jgi:hypothetical protein